MQTTEQLQQLFINYLKENRFQKTPQALYDPVNYILDIGGKRLRPILLLLANQLFKDDVTDALPAAYAIEIFHNFTLLHDDIMDDAPLRRGKMTVHEKYDTPTAILSGDVMMIYAYRFLEKYPQTLIPQLLSIVNRFAIGVCEGQQYDMDFETQENVLLSEYMTMITQKTAVLIQGAMEMGALIGGASAADVQHVANFGRDIGIAFQLQDDILDTFGDPKKFGKKVGGDIIQNKKTFLVIKTLERANAEDSEKLRTFMTTSPYDPTEKIAQVKALFQQYDIKNIAEAAMNTFLTQSLKHLEAVSVPNERKAEIKNLAHYLIQRDV